VILTSKCCCLSFDFEEVSKKKLCECWSQLCRIRCTVAFVSASPKSLLGLFNRCYIAAQFDSISGRSRVLGLSFISKYNSALYWYWHVSSRGSASALCLLYLQICKMASHLTEWEASVDITCAHFPKTCNNSPDADQTIRTCRWVCPS